MDVYYPVAIHVRPLVGRLAGWLVGLFVINPNFWKLHIYTSVWAAFVFERTLYMAPL